MYFSRLVIAALFFLPRTCNADVITGEIFFSTSTIVSGSSGDSILVFRSNTLNDSSGASFRLQVRAEAAAGNIVITTGSNPDLGVEQTSGNDQFDESGDSVTLDSLTVIDFNDGGSGLGPVDVSDIGLTNISLNAAGAGGDTGTINGVAFSGPGSTPISIVGSPASSATLAWTGGSYRLDSVGFTATVAAVPEPNSLWLLGITAVGGTARRRS